MRIKPSPRRRQSGSTLGLIIALLALMTLYAGSNVLTVRYLQKEIQIIDQRQQMRWEGRAKSTPGKLTARPAP